MFCKKKLFLNISQYSQENTCVGVSFVEHLQMAASELILLCLLIFSIFSIFVLQVKTEIITNNKWPNNYNTNMNNMQKKSLAICATQLAGSVLWKKLKYFEVTLNICEFSRVWESIELIAAPHGGFIAPHVWEIVCKNNFTIVKGCHYSRFYIMISLCFHKIEAKNLNLDPSILIFLILGTKSSAAH